MCMCKCVRKYSHCKLDIKQRIIIAKNLVSKKKKVWNINKKGRYPHADIT